MSREKSLVIISVNSDSKNSSSSEGKISSSSEGKISNLA